MAEAVRIELPARVCGLALDIDGTLTEKKRLGEFNISLEAVEAVRRAEAAGIPVMLVTGNSVYVVAGVARYIGASGPHVAENGCIVYDNGTIYRVCRDTARRAARLIEEELAGVLKPSWQNPCRLHDYAFIPKLLEPGEALEAVKRVLSSRGINVKVGFSGYAIHLRPVDASKGRGLKLALKLRGLEPDCVVAVGDSVIDLEMKDAGVILAAVGNADEKLKKNADIVLPGESGRSVKALIDAILSNRG
ncbi:phosphoglycolate phosphatase [Hyperthermus butylicus]|uniref:Phosphoglycolate phosphatase n=1 Tax=Hyperthermus butylicus (strain DSM 5456 / JCM 9403 / PLM1-5) TaxID=415426 RepID=A2BK56_HYPBU|nr:phosphoglycolate phosphatase [Hyperthermus butylicus]ABM80367.1 phosphoglycolate phosphatase [Hyperthermus butylicus DSM 5456]